MRYWWLIILSIFLQACAYRLSPKGTAELVQGKMYYEAGEFKRALHELLPPAVAGNMKAQYAIGYLYYYGYGTTQDTEAGVFWIKKAADKNYMPAIRALKIINGQNTLPGVRQAEIKQADSREVTPVLQQQRDEYNALMTPIPEKVIPEPPKKKDEVLHSLPPKKEIHADGYGLQLLGSYNLETVKKMQTALGVQESSVIWHAEHNKKDWYVLMYGHYKTISDARLAMSTLPSHLQAQGPWVRNMEGLG